MSALFYNTPSIDTTAFPINRHYCLQIASILLHVRSAYFPEVFDSPDLNWKVLNWSSMSSSITFIISGVFKMVFGLAPVHSLFSLVLSMFHLIFAFYYCLYINAECAKNICLFVDEGTVWINLHCDTGQSIKLQGLLIYQWEGSCLGN